MIAADTTLHGILDRLARWFRRDELAGLPQDDVERMAHDLGVCESDLRQLAAADAGSAELLYERLAALGITEADIERVAFGLTRTLETDCARCGSKEQCARDLAEQPQAPGWMSYCSNAQTLASVQCAKGRAFV